jgi:hypothetical protein
MTMREAVERSRGHIEKCEPSFGARVGRWYGELMSKKIPVLIYCSVRTPQEQEELYAKGRTKPGVKVTNARGIPPQSLHIDQGKGSHAIDYVPLARTPSVAISWHRGTMTNLRHHPQDCREARPSRIGLGTTPFRRCKHFWLA